jgi:TonB-linked SusC/RagA family outer membrane protein
MMLGKNKKSCFRSTILLIALIAMLPFTVHAQDTTKVRGIVYSSSGKPLSDVSVSIAGSFELPVITNEAGEFTVLSTSGQDWLIFSSTGAFKMKRVFLNNRNELNVYLTPVDMSSGDDQVTIMSRQQAKRNIAAAISSVNTNEIVHTDPVTVDQYLQGRAAGVFVVNHSGQPGSGTYINIRGINSLNTNNQPLFLIDGIPVTQSGVFSSNIRGFTFNPLVELNPVDVSKINIIKDPAITAAYGSRGSNGLILIETLNPSVTKTEIDLDLKTGITLAPSNTISQLNAQQHKTLMNEVLFSSGMFEEDIKNQYPSLYYDQEDPGYINYQHNTNWQDLIFRNAISTAANINVKGGDEIAIYGLSVGLNKSSGVIKNTDYFGYNLRFVSKLNVFRWMKMNANVALNYNKSNLKDAATSDQTSPILTALGKSPLLNPFQYDEHGNEISAISEVDGIGVSNPVAVINGYEANNTNASFVYSMGLEADINSWISFISKFNLTYNTVKEHIFMPNHGMERYYDGEAINVSKAATDKLSSVYNNTYLSINRTVGNDHNFSSMTGFQVQSNNFEYDWGLTKNAHSSDQYKTLQYGTDNLREIGGVSRIWNWMSVYENLFYTYKDKYMVTASLSFDGSSRIGEDALNTIKLGGQPFGLFYSAGLAWRLSSEPFLKDKYWLEDLKWRFSYGKTGNDDIGESSASNYYKVVQFRETVGLYPAVLTNKELTYENVSQLNTGLDIALWGSRVTATIDLYKSQTTNMLIYAPVDSYLGFDYRMENSGKMTNKGLEFTAYARIKSEGDIKWDIQGNFSTIKNEVTDIKGSKIITEIQGGEIVNMQGQPANSFYGYVYKGVFAREQDAVAANLVNDRGFAFGAGDAIFADLSGPDGTPDGVINDYDKTTIGSPLPSFTGALLNTFTYKKFALSATIQFVTGNEIFNYVRFKNEQMTGLQNQSAYVLNRWQYEGQVTNVPRALWEDPMGNSAFSTRWIEDGSYVKLKNITLSYRIPDEFLKFKNAEFYISINNILTFTKYLGYDPEFSYSFMQIHQGIDYGLTPQTRQFLVGVKVGL